jgi:hypothetical protein
LSSSVHSVGSGSRSCRIKRTRGGSCRSDHFIQGLGRIIQLIEVQSGWIIEWGKALTDKIIYWVERLDGSDYLVE